MPALKAHLRLSLEPPQGWSFTFDREQISNWLQAPCSGPMLEVMTGSFFRDMTVSHLS